MGYSLEWPETADTKSLSLRCRHFNGRNRMAVCASGSPRSGAAGDLAEHGLGGQAMERHDGGEIGAAEPVMGENHGGGGHVPACLRGRNVHHDAEIQMTVVES